MQKQTPRKTYAFVGDGETEQWYLQMLKKNETNLTVTIKPELPQDKSIEDQWGTGTDSLFCTISTVGFH